MVMRKRGSQIVALVVVVLSLLLTQELSSFAIYAPPNQTPSPPAQTPTPQAQADQWTNEGLALYNKGDWAGAATAFNRALEIYRQLGDARSQASVTYSLGIIAVKAGQPAQGMDYFDEALALAGAAQDLSLQLSIHISIGLAHYSAGAYERALAAYQTAVELARQTGDRASERLMLTSVAGLSSLLGRSTEALDAYAAALKLARADGDSAGQQRLWLNIGDLRYAAGQYGPAREAYQAALSLAQVLGDSAGALRGLLGVGDGYAAEDAYAPAEEAYQGALTLAGALGDAAGEQQALTELGWIAYRGEAYPQAEGYYQRALDLARGRGARADEASLLGRIGLTRFWSSRPDAAEEPYQQALALWRELGDLEMEGQTLDALGSIYADAGKVEPALDALQAALAIWRESGATQSEALTLRAIGAAHIAQGQYEEAGAALDEAQGKAQAAGDDFAAAMALSTHAGVYLRQGEYHRALNLLQQAREMLDALGDPVNAARMARNIANIYIDVGQFERALPLFQEALDAFAGQRGVKRDVAGVLNSMGLVYDYLGQANMALDFYQRAVPAAQDAHDRGGEAMALNNLGMYHDSQGQYDLALSYSRQALDIQRALSDRSGEARSLNNIGYTHHNLKDWDRAESHYEQALDIWLALDDQANLAAGYANLGVLYEDRGDAQRALEFYEKSMSLREKLRAAAGLEEFKSSMAGLYASVYLRAARLYARRGDAAGAFSVSERARARSFLDQLGGSRLDIRATADAEMVNQEQTLRNRLYTLEKELSETRAGAGGQRSASQTQEKYRQLAAARQDYETLLAELKLSNPDYAALVSATPAGLADVQRLLDDQTTLLAYFLTDEQPLAFVVRRDQISSFELPIRAAELAATIDEFRSFADLSDATPASLQRLYDGLIRPLRAELRTPRLGIIPHLRLHYVPFAAFYDGEQYLSEQFTLFYLPSAGVLPYLQSRAGGDTMLAMAYGQAQGLPLLRYADREAQEIAGLYGTPAIIGAAATETEFRQRAGAAGVIHLAAHGQFDEAQPLFSRIVLAPDGQSDGAVEVHEVYGLKLEATDLVVLSACQTQLGQTSYGDDVVGLNRAFLFAGAPSVIASLWSVDDAATEKLMTAFYRNRRAGRPKAEALRAAQAEVRQAYPHPYYWAAFVLNGEPGAPEGSAGGRSKATTMLLWAGAALAGVLAGSAIGAGRKRIALARRRSGVL
jgi:CHAT domain-containing protein/Tfp pilus assembly protein PilF